MHITSWKWQIGVSWVMLVALIGYAVSPASMAGWTLVTAVAMTLPAAFMRFWREPEPSMSESIRAALR